PLKHRARVRCHVGTAEFIASLSLVDRDRLSAGETAPAQILLGEPAATVWGQPLVIRSESPVVTLGGGVVLDPHAPRLRRNAPAVLDRLAELSSPDPVTRAAAALYFIGIGEWQPRDLARAAGVNDASAVIDELLRRGDLVDLKLSPSRALRVARRALGEIFDRIEAMLVKEHQQFPLRTMLDRSRLVNRIRYLGDDALVDAVLAAMNRAGRLQTGERGVALPGRGPQLSNNEQKLLAQIIETYRQSGYQPPSVDEVRAQASKNQQVVGQLVSLAAAEGELVEIAPGLYLHAENERRMKAMLAEPLKAAGGLTVSQIRELLSTSRKYAVPICEYLDRTGFTRRQGDQRVLA
ncbi:MAG TPA: SelB C-terminal domain-containing protein, partial [Pirellulales bacterium]|nr:SelB C-terminal domain-containing protein [Pirellulales bacterium]